MSTVKISELVVLPNISANTSNTIFLGVDLPTNITGRFTATTLAQQLFANNYLVVGQNYQTIFPNTVGQISGSDPTFLQFNMQNFSNTGSADFVVTADTGTNSNSYIDMGINNSNYSDPNFSSMNPYDGYLYVHGPTDTSYQGNLILGAFSSNANIYFIAGGTQRSNIALHISNTALVLDPGTRLIFGDNTIQTTASIGSNYSQAAYALANTNAADIVLIKATNAIQNANISTVVTQSQAAFDLANTNSNTITYITGVNAYQNTHSNAAFAKANAALANATGTFAGDLTITGNTFAQKMNTANLQVNGTANVSGTLDVRGIITGNAQVVFQNTQFTATQSALTISASPTVATPSNDGYMLHLSGKNGVPSRVVTDSYGANAYVVFAGRSARGTIDTPSALQANDIITRIASNGYGTTKYQTLGVGRIDFIAAENFTDTATGSRIQFWNCPIGSNTLTNIATFNGDSVEFTGAVKPEKGFIYTPTVLPGAQTAFTIDFSTTSLIKASLAADLTITLSNYVYGKVVEVWLTNTGGLTRTVTHGCTATNSTENSTTFTMPATSSAYLRYFSIDGDNANTFVAIQHA